MTPIYFLMTTAPTFWGWQYKNEKQKLSKYAVTKEIGHEEPYYTTKISIFSFTWAGLASFHKSSTIWVLSMSFDRFLLAVESRDLSQADKSIIRVSSFPN
jgi:hypothetical protein